MKIGRVVLDAVRDALSGKKPYKNFFWLKYDEIEIDTSDGVVIRFLLDGDIMSEQKEKEKNFESGETLHIKNIEGHTKVGIECFMPPLQTRR